MRYRVIVLVTIIGIFSVGKTVAQSSVDQAKYNDAMRVLAQWRVLDDLRRKANTDAEQSVMRRDAIIFCYEIMKALKDINTAELSQNIRGLEASIAELRRQINTTKPTVTTPIDNQEIAQIKDIIDENKNNIRSLQTLKSETDRLNDKFVALSKVIEDYQHRPTSQFDKRVKQNTIIATTAVAAAVVLTLIAAR